MKFSIVIPFEEAEINTHIWANDEYKIDFRKQITEAARCTTAFAATELKHYLSQTCPKLEIEFRSQLQKDSFSIDLNICNPASRASGFILEPIVNGLRITGDGRTGLLYGVYEFLRIQGWRWYAPGSGGEFVPACRDFPIIPNLKKEYQPSMSLGRGFDFEGVSKESERLLLWMARNRLNVCGYRPNTIALAEKLGMTLKTGGHIFESILDPDQRVVGGTTLWEKHPEWYGLPANGIREKEKALWVQFCVSCSDLRDFLASKLLDLVMGDWYEADRIDIWGFDTWGNCCTCQNCAKLGNGSDQALFFLSSLRGAIDVSRTQGKLDHDITLVMCAYEGTTTIDGPVNPIPDNLIRAGDIIVFYPINRCYAHNFIDDSCHRNNQYRRSLQTWTSLSPGMPIMVGEYYNLSRFEDLPLLFTNRICHDLKDYFDINVRGLTYMHIPIVNWGIRTLTQALYAQICWDAQTDEKLFIQEYFNNWYGSYAVQLRKAYEFIEQAWLYISDLRAWGKFSVLANLLKWDGAIPKESFLSCDESIHLTDASTMVVGRNAVSHFSNVSEIIEVGRTAVMQLRASLNIINEAYHKEKIVVAQTTPTSYVIAVNPLEARNEARKREQACRYESRLSEDRRLLIYGIDSLGILVELVAYHDALYRGDFLEAERVWIEIEKIAELLDSYYIPIQYDSQGADLISNDALTRTQVREILRKCRKYRSKS